MIGGGGTRRGEIPAGNGGVLRWKEDRGALAVGKFCCWGSVPRRALWCVDGWSGHRFCGESTSSCPSLWTRFWGMIARFAFRRFISGYFVEYNHSSRLFTDPFFGHIICGIERFPSFLPTRFLPLCCDNNSFCFPTV